MSNNDLNRIGGIAAIVGILIMFGGAALLLLVPVGLLVTAVYYFALYRSNSSALNLVATLLAAGGSIAMFFTGVGGASGYGLALLAALNLPPLLAGFAGYTKADLPRFLSIAGIIAGVFGVLNAVVVSIGGGDYANPNNPALTPFIYGTYLPAMLAVLTWLVWGGIRMFRKA